MIQFNLLPDVKMQFMKAERTKHTVMLVAIIAGGAALTILIFLFILVNVAQKQHLTNLSKDIKELSGKLESTQDLDKILTVQNQLGSLTDLHDKKVVSSRLSGYLSQITPAQANISRLKIKFDDNTITIEGEADNLITVNKFADILKFCTFNLVDENGQVEEGEGKNAFSDVVLTSFTRDSDTTKYTLDAKFDPQIFDNASGVKLTVPNIISTRSETQKPKALFQPESEGGQQ